MPLFNYKCTSCDLTCRKVLDKAIKELDCACGGKMMRAPKGGSSQVMETLDNGVMTKRVVRLADAERLYKNRGIDKPDGETI